MKRKLNIAMIGHRFMGKAHSNAWRQVGRFFDLPIDPVMKVICGRDEAAVKSAADKYGWLEHSTSWQQVVERKDIDVIDICVPNNLHAEIATSAAQAGKTTARHSTAPAIIDRNLTCIGILSPLRPAR